MHKNVVCTVQTLVVVRLFVHRVPGTHVVCTVQALLSVREMERTSRGGYENVVVVRAEGPASKQGPSIHTTN